MSTFALIIDLKVRSYNENAYGEFIADLLFEVILLYFNGPAAPDVFLGCRVQQAVLLGGA